MKLTFRTPLQMIVLTIVTFGLYSLYWIISTKLELNRAGAKIPTAWLLIIPLANIYFYYKFAEAFAVLILDKEADSWEPLVYFLLLLLVIAPIGAILCQIKINKKIRSL